MEFDNEKSASVMKMGEWVLSIIISCIPLVGIIMLFVWAFSGDVNANKKNWAKAMLVIQLIGIVLIVLLYIFVLASAFALRN
jgi:hypothetical protein